MTIQELFIRSNQALLKVIIQITTSQWELPMPPGTSSKPSSLKAAVQYHTYDDAWVPDILAGKTKQEVGERYEYLRQSENIISEYEKFNLAASDAVRNFTDLNRVTHLSYGDFPARDYLQHIVSFRAFRAYDIAKLIGVDTKLDDDFVQAMIDEYSPVIVGYRQMGVFPPEIQVPDDVSNQVKLLAMVGRT